MTQFAVNLSTIFTEVPFLERFKKAKEAGFSYVECQSPYDYTIESIKQELEAHQLSLILINFPAGNKEQGDRGLAIDQNRIAEFKTSVAEGIRYATALKCPRMHCMAGVLTSELDPEESREIFKSNLNYAARQMRDHDLMLLIEPINTYDIPDYFLANLQQAVDIIYEIGVPNIKLQFDFYHMQRIQGNLLSSFQTYMNIIGHVQIADVPGRHQPGTGEINYEGVFEFIKELAYKGMIGLEYIPKGKSEESFGWIDRSV